MSRSANRSNTSPSRAGSSPAGDQTGMAVYSINDLEKLTGIKKHTIRIWEQRYGIITPHRTSTNIRYYTDAELKHLFNIALLNRNGFKISKLSQLSKQEISAMVAGVSSRNNGPEQQTESLTLAMLHLDELAFERIFSAQAAEKSFEGAMVELVYPLLEKLKALWITRSIKPIHEKFITHIIRRKLLCAIDDLPLPEARSTFLLYLPDGEAQELTLLFVYYLLRKRGQKIIYLGANVTVGDLVDACSSVRPEFVFTILESPPLRQSVQNYIDSVTAVNAQSHFLFTGSQIFLHAVKLPPNATKIGGLADTLTFLDRMDATKESGRASIA